MFPRSFAFFLIFQISVNLQSQSLLQFMHPPASAKPRVWWHWMNGNITKDGIKKDLDWMSATGIGGMHNFDANLFTPVVVPKKLVFMTPEWKDAFKFATQYADKKGLELTIAGSPGWSVTGGPWVEPKDAMKKYVWTETTVYGDMKVSLKLPQPSDAFGKFQNAVTPSTLFSNGSATKPLGYFQDECVIAFKNTNADRPVQFYQPRVSSSGGKFYLDSLTDGDLMHASFLPPMAVNEDMWIQYEFDTARTFKAVSLAGAMTNALSDFNGVILNRSLKISDDGINFKEIAKFTGSNNPFNTISFTPAKAKFWRLAVKTLPPPINPFAAMFGGNPVGEKSEGINISEFLLYNTDRVDQIEDKAAFTPWKEDNTSYISSGADAINPKDIIDITSKMKSDGTLEWQVPPGQWQIIRFGYSCTGRENHPASPEATGLEVDKLDKEAVKKYINTYLDMYKQATGGMMGAKGLQYMVLDSYEAGHMTWTRLFASEFLKRRGYDIHVWLPVLTGRIVDNATASEKFLWDFRKTIGELIAENHYDVIGDELRKRGMKRYTESHEDRRIYMADGMDVKKNADIPMAAMWTPGSLAGGANEEVRSEGDIRESASVANIYGKPFVAAESLTSIQNAFSWHPERLKRTADLEMASGLNRFVIHTSVHQPLDDKKPGFSLGPFGQYFTRHETWSGAGAKAWISYLSRSSYMLQQGKNIADVLCYYPENTNITWITRESLPGIPKGLEFDFVNSSALINAIQAKNGKLAAPSGNVYHVLMLHPTAKYMTLPVLKKIKSLVQSGIKLIGDKPLYSPTLLENQNEFESIANEIWSHKNVTSFEALNLIPDVQVHGTDHTILFRHRTLHAGTSTEIYWLDNRSNDPTDATIQFRVDGKIPMKWNAETGTSEPVSYEIKNGTTVIPLHFESWESFFIVFKDKALNKSWTIRKPTTSVVTAVNSHWTIDFGNNKKLDSDHLTSWSASNDEEIQYFSGTAEYQNKFKIPSIHAGSKYILQLDQLYQIAEVFINNKNAGTIWKKPYQLDITKALRLGNNDIKIKVTNLWINRLIGDAQPGVKSKTTFTTIPFYQANSKLVESGIIGEVQVLERQ